MSFRPYRITVSPAVEIEHGTGIFGCWLVGVQIYHMQGGIWSAFCWHFDDGLLEIILLTIRLYTDFRGDIKRTGLLMSESCGCGSKKCYGETAAQRIGFVPKDERLGYVFEDTEDLVDD